MSFRDNKYVASFIVVLTFEVMLQLSYALFVAGLKMRPSSDIHNDQSSLAMDVFFVSIIGKIICIH
ncbi:hypothetical protein FB567DRAFT_512543 [Paraphoma chrysanthemicola]|uniref:Uncharacterized protein n=1 Tax=Paraphoma chrysanthemicola TaxID=798071 RepID=A0A8K0RKC9_9PLEO|nr:hypothetical protein FB567DRAFT_512543 [Paraphoma chrysanthemicola]